MERSIKDATTQPEVILARILRGSPYTHYRGHRLSAADDASAATSAPPVVVHIPAPRPEGFVGNGQDTVWATNAFAFAATNILSEGYATWLTEYVGINEQNGRYKVSLTISSVPDNGAPCYLVCGPYKVIVTGPGTYSFPLDVCVEYTARTYPEALPMTIAYDDGYRGPLWAQSNLCAQSNLLARPTSAVPTEGARRPRSAASTAMPHIYNVLVLLRMMCHCTGSSFLVIYIANETRIADKYKEDNGLYNRRFGCNGKSFT